MMIFQHPLLNLLFHKSAATATTSLIIISSSSSLLAESFPFKSITKRPTYNRYIQVKQRTLFFSTFTSRRSHNSHLNASTFTTTSISMSSSNSNSNINSKSNSNHNDEALTSITTRNTIQKAKQNLRLKIRSQLKSLTRQQIITQSQQVWQSLYNLPQYKNASSIGLFLSMPHGEINTEDLCVQVLKDGKDLYVPRVGLDFEQCDMDFIQVVNHNDNNMNHLMNRYDDSSNILFYKSWPVNKWGIPEPPRDVQYQIAIQGSIDLLIVPGLGFDRYGRRLGQGKGYYDRFITKMSSGDGGEEGEERNRKKQKPKKPFLVAVGLEPSFVDNDYGGIPTNDHDCIMDVVILPQTGVLTISP